MPRDGDLTPTPRPLGLGHDVGRWIATLVIGVLIALGYYFGFPWAFETAVRAGFG